MCWLGAQIPGSRSWARQWPPKQTAGWQARRRSWAGPHLECWLAQLRWPDFPCSPAPEAWTLALTVQERAGVGENVAYMGFFSCWGHRLMQPGTFQLTHRSLPPGPLYQIQRNPLAGNTIHAVPGRETAAPATRQGLAHGDTRSSHLLFLILACTATGQSTVCQLSQMGLPPPP